MAHSHKPDMLLNRAISWIATAILFASIAVKCESNDSEVLCNTVGPNFHECTFSDQSSIEISQENNIQLSITCFRITPENFNYPLWTNLKDFEIESVDFNGCPLPTTSFSNVINSLGYKTDKITNFTINSRNSDHKYKLNLNTFYNLTSLEYINMSSNNISGIEENTFENLKNLMELHLQVNEIKELSSNTFSRLTRLKYLALNTNNLETLPEQVFRNLKNLYALNLSENKLVSLNEDIFKDLISLKYLDIKNNRLTELPTEIFYNLEKLTRLTISGNNFEILNYGLFLKNHLLETISIEGKETLNFLAPILLKDLSNLKEIYLDKNNITYLWEYFFNDSKNLENISIAKNRLTSLPSKLFQHQTKLKRLILNENMLTKILDSTFSNLISLQTLELNNNKLNEISRHAFDTNINLRTVDMSYNKLTFDDNISHVSPFNNLINLSILNLNSNNISRMPLEWRTTLPNLSLLQLRNNNFKYLEFEDFKFSSRDLKIDLRANKITTIKWPNSSDSLTGIIIQLDSNPIHCDCHVMNFLHIFMQIIPEIVLDATCASPKYLQNRPLKSIKTDDLLCPAHQDLSKSTKCDYNEKTNGKSLIVTCPKLNMGSNEEQFIPNLSSNLSRIEFHYENNFDPNIMKALRNQININKIDKLLLNGNNISTITSDSIPKSLQVLDLRNNKLKIISVEVVNVLKKSIALKEMWLSGNPLKCSCENYELFSFLQSNYTRVMDSKDSTCADGRVVLTVQLANLCEFRWWISSSISLTTIFIFIGVLFGLYYKFKLEIKVWLYSKNIWCGNEPDDDKIYDAFISYSHKDEEFITKTIVPHLEESGNYKLCLHYRNWVPGEFISTQIASSVEQSRRTLIVVSPNFLESVWGRMEFRTAHQRALKEGRARVVVVLYADIGPTDYLDPELKAYLTMNTYVKWGDPWFWDKLKYALSHRKK